MLPFGTVHPAIRCVVGVVALLVGIAVALPLPRHVAARAPVLWVALPLWFAAFTSAFLLLPFGPAGRSVLQPGLAPLLSEIDGVAGGINPVLAIDPRAAALGQIWIAAMPVVMLATAAIIASSRRAARVSTVLIATALAVAAVAVVQRVTGAQSVGWITGVGAGQDFFGPFVYRNAGGVLCAAMVPLAVARATIGRSSTRTIGWVAAAVLTLATVLSTSRGSVLALGVGIWVMAWAATTGTPRRILAFSPLLIVIVLLAIGPTDALSWLSYQVRPSLGEHAELSSGRDTIWTDQALLWLKSPLLGGGAGGFNDLFVLVKSTPGWVRMAHAHQEVIELGVNQGVVGLLAWAFALVAGGCVVVPALRRVTGERRQWLAGYLGSAAVLTAGSQWDFPLRHGALAILAALVGGTILGLATDRDADPGTIGVRLQQGGVLAMAGLATVGAVLFGTGIGPFAGVETALTGAERALTDGRPVEAQSAFREVVYRRPLSIPALSGLARATAATGDVEAARATWKVVTEVYPTSPAAWLGLARIERASGHETQARQAWRTLLELDFPETPNDPVYDEAIAGVPPSALQAVWPARESRWCGLAVAVERRGDRENAERLYRWVGETQPECKMVLAFRLYIWGRYDEAAAVLDAMPDGCARDSLLADIREGQGRTAEVLPLRERAFAVCGSDHTEARVALGLARIVSGDLSGAAMVRVAIAEKPDDWVTRRRLAGAFLAARRFDDAAVELNALIAGGAATPADRATLERIDPFLSGAPP